MTDFPGTLWPASYRGIPFHVLKEGASGGRRIAVHEFPYRDEPFLEDMGRSKREFPVSAYVASDSALAEAGALEAALSAKGPAPLVLPGRGALNARLMTFERAMERDTLGYIAFDLRFIAEGAASALASVAALTSGLFAAGDALAQAAGVLFEGLDLIGFRGDLATTAISLAEDAVATFEAARVSETVDPLVSGKVRDALISLYADTPALISRATGADASFAVRLVTAARDLAGGMDPARSLATFGAIADSSTTPAIPSLATVSAAALGANAQILARVQRVAALAAYADSVAHATFDARRDGITARADLSERFAAAIADASGGQDIVLVDALAASRGAAVAYLSQVIVDLRPVVVVTSHARLPALWWAQRLYGSADLALDLATRNLARHAGFMPETFEALRP